MNCIKCGAPMAEGSLFCAKCGYSANSRNRKRNTTIALVIIGVLLLSGAIAWMLRKPGSADVTAATGKYQTGAQVTNANGRVEAAPAMTAQSGVITPNAPPPADIVAYINFVRSIELKRVALRSNQLGEVLALSTDMTVKNLQQAMSGNLDSNGKSLQSMQQQLANWITQWQQLAQQFNSYPYPVPSACQPLQASYLQVLGTTSAVMASISGSISQAMGGDPTHALQALEGMKGSSNQFGSASQQVNQSCIAADNNLSVLCNTYKIPKDFSIQDDSGGTNPLSSMQMP